MTPDERKELMHEGSIAWRKHGAVAVCPYAWGTAAAGAWMHGYSVARRLTGKEPKLVNTTLTDPS